MWTPPAMALDLARQIDDLRHALHRIADNARELAPEDIAAMARRALGDVTS